MDIFTLAKLDGIDLIILTPEMLESPCFTPVLTTISKGLTGIVIDKAYLCDEWVEWCDAYSPFTNIRSRISSSVW